MYKMVLRIAHRGASDYFPENTLEAFRKAVKLKLDVVEFDVHHTKDGKLVIMHDHNVRRTTDGCGSIHTLSLKELRKFHEPNGEAIPTLQEVINILKNKCICKIDIKDSNITEKVLKMIKKNHIENSVVITSELISVLKKTKNLSPEIKIELGGFKEKRPIEEMIKEVKDINAEIISPHYSIITKKLVDESHKNGLEVHVWTVDDPKLMKKMIKLGVDGITSNYADKI